MIGESLKAHIRRIRLERGAMHLKRTNRPIFDIALTAGYDSHEAFTRAFRTLIGYSPSEFRNRWRQLGAGSSPPSGVRYDPDLALEDFNRRVRRSSPQAGADKDQRGVRTSAGPLAL